MIHMLDKLKPKKPAKRQVFNDAFFCDPANLIDEFSDLKMEMDPSSEGKMTGEELLNFMYRDRMRQWTEDCERITAKLPARPFIGVGSVFGGGDSYRPAWFIVGNIADIRRKVTNDLLRELVVWDENGRLFAEGYSYNRRVRRWDFKQGHLYEVRQLNERGLELLKKTAEGDEIPVEKLFSKRYSDPPRIAELVFAFPPVQWARPDDAPMYKPDTLVEMQKRAEDVAFDMGGSFESGAVSRRAVKR